MFLDSIDTNQHVTAVRADKGSEDGGNDAHNQARVHKRKWHAQNASTQ